MISEKCIFNVCWHPNLSEIQHANYGSKYLQTRDATTEVHISRNCNTPRMCCYLHDTTIFFLSSILHAANVGGGCSVGIAKCSYRGLIFLLQKCYFCARSKSLWASPIASKTLLIQAAFFFFWPWAQKLFEAYSLSSSLFIKSESHFWLYHILNNNSTKLPGID